MQKNELKVVEKNPVAFTQQFNALLDTSNIKTASESEIVIKSALKIAEMTLLPLCRACYMFKKLTKLTKDDLKKWSQDNLGKGVNTFYAYCNVGEFVIENGQATYFNIENDDNSISDYTYAKLNKIIEKASYKAFKTFDERVNAIASFINSKGIKPTMSLAEIEEILKGKNLGEIIDQATEQVTEQVTEQATEQATDKANKETEKEIIKHIKESKLYQDMCNDIINEIRKNTNVLTQNVKYTIKIEIVKE